MCYINLGAVLGGPARGLCLSGDLRPRRLIYGTGMEGLEVRGGLAKWQTEHFENK